MTVNAWIDENGNLYLAGKDSVNGALHVSAKEGMDAANKVIAESGGFKKLRLADLHRFETLWVAPEALGEEYWPDDQWVKVDSYEADEHYEAQGWIPVLTITLLDEPDEESHPLEHSGRANRYSGRD